MVGYLPDYFYSADWGIRLVFDLFVLKWMRTDKDDPLFAAPSV